MPAYQQDYYALLGVMRDASQEEIKRAYLTAAQKFHPDKNTAAGETELFLGVQQAYEVLSNPKRRAQYDATLPPEKRRVLPYEHRILYSRPNLVGLDEPQMLYLILEIGAPAEARQAPAPPLNVCLVLDRSTSMQGEKMDTVKSAALQVLRNLRQQDILSVVAFSDRAEVIIPAAYLQDRARLLHGDLEGYRIAGSKDVPDIEAVMFEVANAGNSVGMVGLGEPPKVPTAGAIANAVFHACGARVRELPISPARVLAALAEGGR